jgi:hypothetical protein
VMMLAAIRIPPAMVSMGSKVLSSGARFSLGS